MAKKSRAIPLPDLHGKSVLDVGCDHAWWCWEAARLGASRILGLDRNRKVYGTLRDLIELNTKAAGDRPCTFKKVDLGKQWHDCGLYDVVFCFSVYHHIYEGCGDHDSVWFWLWMHTAEQLLWEGPTGTDDCVVKMNVTFPYKREEILEAANKYFDVEIIGPALHVKTREVWRCWPKELASRKWDAKIRSGTGGATAAFTREGGRRIREIESILGFTPYPGSLNLDVNPDFDWDNRYYRSRLLDPVSRRDVDGPWLPRWIRFYPLVTGTAMRFEDELYGKDFVELIDRERLRDTLPDRFTLHG